MTAKDSVKSVTLPFLLTRCGCLAVLWVNDSVSVALKVLWGEEQADKGLADRQSFVDLGCGNGLLVHILTNEGVSWMLLCPSVELKLCLYVVFPAKKKTIDTILLNHLLGR